MSKEINLKTSEYLLKCKKTKELFADVDNVSGSLTLHIKKYYPDFVIESKFKRKQIEIKTGEKWYAVFFEKIKNKNISEIKKCHYCEWETIDLDNRSGSYTKHLLEKHNITLDKYIVENPEEKYLLNTKNDKDLNYGDCVECAVCGEKMNYITNTHLQKHNMTPQQYKEKYPNAKYGSDEFYNKVSKK